MVATTDSFMELIQLCSTESDVFAWQEFHNRFNHYITGYVKKALRQRTNNGFGQITYSEDLLNDLLQDVYVQLLENNRQALRTFKGFTESSFLAYLARISTNVVIEYFRKQLANKRKAAQISIDSLNQTGNSNGFFQYNFTFNCLIQEQEDNLINQVAIRELVQLLNKNFTEKKAKRDKTVFILHSFYGFTPKQIVGMSELNLSYANVELIIRRVRQQLLSAWS